MLRKEKEAVMFCGVCGNELHGKGSFCPKCGSRIPSVPGRAENTAFERVPSYAAGSRSTVLPAGQAAGKPEQGLLMMRCSCCGAGLSVKEEEEIARCEFCGTSFVLNRPQKTVTGQEQQIPLSREEKAASAVRTFLSELRSFREETRQRLIPKTVRGFFGKVRPGTAEDVNDTELGEAVAEFIYGYEIPHDEQTLIEFYLLSLKYSREDAYGEEVDNEEQCELEAWTKKNEELQKLLKCLYPNSERVKEITKKSFRRQMKEFLNDDGLENVVGVIGAAGSLFGIARGLKRFL